MAWHLATPSDTGWEDRSLISKTHQQQREDTSTMADIVEGAKIGVGVTREMWNLLKSLWARRSMKTRNVQERYKSQICHPLNGEWVRHAYWAETNMNGTASLYAFGNASYILKLPVVSGTNHQQKPLKYLVILKTQCWRFKNLNSKGCILHQQQTTIRQQREVRNSVKSNTSPYSRKFHVPFLSILTHGGTTARQGCGDATVAGCLHENPICQISHLESDQRASETPVLVVRLLHNVTKINDLIKV